MSYRTGRPQNYADVVFDGIADADRLSERTIQGISTVQCPCGRWVKAFVMVDIRGLPTEITQGQKWACDSCWDSWTRDGARTQRTLEGKLFTAVNWVELLGAPLEIVGKFRTQALEKTRHMETKRTQAEGRGDTRDAARWQNKIDQLGQSA